MKVLHNKRLVPVCPFTSQFFPNLNSNFSHSFRFGLFFALSEIDLMFGTIVVIYTSK